VLFDSILDHPFGALQEETCAFSQLRFLSANTDIGWFIDLIWIIILQTGLRGINDTFESMIHQIITAEYNNATSATFVLVLSTPCRKRWIILHLQLLLFALFLLLRSLFLIILHLIGSYLCLLVQYVFHTHSLLLYLVTFGTVLRLWTVQSCSLLSCLLILILYIIIYVCLFLLLVHVEVLEVGFRVLILFFYLILSYIVRA
jgi:hypothetical protein